MRRILVADDSIFMRTIMKRMLIKLGHMVVGEAENGRIAFEKYKELSPDIVTMDITMDEMNGLESLREIIKYDKHAKVIMVSAMGQESFVREAINFGAKGFLVKPMQEEFVVAAISKLYHG